MRSQKQQIRHDPKNGKWGDCYRTCVAVILGVPAKDVPNFCEGGDNNGIDEAREWLRPQGMGIWQNIYLPTTSLNEILASSLQLSPGVPFIVTGKSARGVNHCVVAQDGKIVCDPYAGKAVDNPFTGPAENGDEKFWWVEVLTKAH